MQAVVVYNLKRGR